MKHSVLRSKIIILDFYKLEIFFVDLQAEDAVCLSDYCDIMRCDVLMTQDPKTVYPDTMLNTDIEIWREATSYAKALSPAGPREVAKYTFKGGIYQQFRNKKPEEKHCQKDESPDKNGR